MPGPGSTSNVIAALASFFVPGLGQLVQGRIAMALVQFLAGVVIWIVSLGTLGWIVHLWSVIDAALWRGAAGRLSRPDARYNRSPEA
jgi:TM2 domain-containing membrane protein YozV